MVNNLFQNIANAAGLSSYQIGLLQTKAYRILNHETARILKQYDITPIDWALLGLLYDSQLQSKGGRRLSDIAEELGVEAPFVTERAQDLIKLKLVSIIQSKDDKRVKHMELTEKAKLQIPSIEKDLLASMRPLIQGSSIKEILGYKKVLEQIVKNRPKKL